MLQRSIVSRLAFLLAAPFALANLPAASEPPPDMSYQGQLLDAQGVPKTGTVNIQIRIYEIGNRCDCDLKDNFRGGPDFALYKRVQCAARPKRAYAAGWRCFLRKCTRISNNVSHASS